jgi:serine/threonine protein kinase
MAMEYIQGKNLKETLKNDGPFDVTRMLTIILQVCDVISTAHKHPKKIIHRDITPQNIMLAKAGKTNDFVKVLDFGIAKLWTQDNISMTGSILGTPLYMAPEQWKGECDERTDIYSLGMVMYEMLAGKPPFHGDQHILMNKHLHEKPPHFNKVNKSLKIPLVIENIVFKCLEKKKEKRPQSIDELALLLKNAQNSKLNRTRYAKVKLAVTVLVSLTISSITYLFFLSHQYKDTIPDKTISTSEIPIKTNKIPAVNTGPLLENSHKHEQLSQDTKPEININSLSGKEPDNTISVMPNNTKKEHIDTLQDTPQDNISKLAISTTKNTDKVVDNVKKYDINKKPEPTNIKTRKNEQTATEIQIWLQEYKKALETGDIETLKNIGHISSEKEEDKLRQHYSYINNFSISVQNEAIKLSNNRNLAIVSFDRTDEWIDERGNQHKENLPRITKILRKENNIWKITK